MKNLIAFPVLLLAFVIQSAIASRIPLLAGSADLPLVILAAWALQERVELAWLWALVAAIFAGFFSAVPVAAYFLGYLLVVGLARFVQRQVWQLPILAMFTVVFMGTIFFHLLVYLTLRLYGSPILFEDALSLITLPTLFLNFFLAIPVHSLMRDLALWVYPSEELI
jgi:hypothetical protein